MRVTWPHAVTGYVKYGKASNDAANASYFVPQGLTIDGNTVKFTITNGQLGDDDWLADGNISDPNGPAEPMTITVAPTSVPALDHAALALLGLLLAVWSMRRMHLR